MLLGWLFLQVPLSAQTSEWSEYEQMKLQSWKQKSRSLLAQNADQALQLARNYVDSAQTGSALLQGEALANLGIVSLMAEQAQQAVKPSNKPFASFMPPETLLVQVTATATSAWPMPNSSD